MAKKKIRQNKYKKKTRKTHSRGRGRFKSPVVLSVTTLAGIGLLSLMSLGLVFIHDLLMQWSYFEATAISANEGQRLSRADILNQAGIRIGDNILSMNLTLVRARLMSHPWISEAEVARVFPAAVSITVKEHDPVAVLYLGRHFLINGQGEIFKEMDETDQPLLPIVTGLDYSDLNPSGQPRGMAYAAVMEALELKQKAEKDIPGLVIRQIDVDREIGLKLYTSGRIKSILLGYSHYGVKYDRLKKIYFYLKREKLFTKVDSLNLVNLDRIVLRPAKVLSSARKQKEVTRART